MTARRLLVVTAAVALGGLVPPASAQADGDRPGAPVTQDDRVVIRGGATGLVDAVANDSDPDGDELDVCRVDIPDGVPLVSGTAIIIGSAGDDDEARPIDIASTSYAPGRYRITYYACDRDYLVPGTITVVVERTRPVRARKVAPHVVRFVNPDDRPVRVLVLDGISSGPDGDAQQRTLAPGSASRVRIAGRTAFWFASSHRGGDAGSGQLRGLGRA